MATSIQNVIQTLYKVSRTPFKIESGVPYPPKKDYLSNPDTVFYITAIQNSMAIKPLKDQGLVDEDITTVILFILQLVNTQIDLEGVLSIEPSLEYLFNEAFGEAGITKENADRTAIEIIMEEWFKKLKKNPQYTLNFYEKCPDYEKSPLLSYHAVAYDSCKLPDGTFPFYATYAYELHKRLRFNERLGLDSNTHVGYVRSIRFFFLHCSAETKKRTDLTSGYLPASVIKDFLAGYKASRMGHSKSENIGETAESYQVRIYDLWHERAIPSRQRFRKGGNKASKQSDDLSSPGTIEEDPEFKSTGLLFDDDDDEKDDWDGSEHNPDEDWNFASRPGEETQITTDKDPEIHDKNWIDRFHLRNFHFFWETKYLDLFHYAILYHAMSALLDEKQPALKKRILVIYFYLLIHTGIGSKRLLDLRGSSKTIIPDTEPALIRITNRYYLLNPILAKLRTGPEPGICFPISSRVYIPIPDRIAKLFPHDILKNEYIFSYANKDKKTVRLHPDSIFAFLKNVNASFKRYTPKITLARIASSFLPLYHHRYGLDPILGCHISGKDRQRLFGAQMHYIYIEHKTLANAYLRTFNEVDLNIRKNFNHCAKIGLIKAKIKPAIRENQEETQDSHFPGYGSPFIPKDDYLSSMIKILREAVGNEKDLVLRHNLYTIYTYLGLQFAAALRPRNKPQLPWSRFNSMAGTILIKDKQSVKYREERLLPLPRVMLSLVANLRSGLSTLEDHITRHINMRDQRDNTNIMIFFIDERGRVIPFTIQEMLTKLNKIGIDYSLPPNMPRHYCRSYLYTRVSNDLADIWMGHQHLGREVMSIISSAVFADAARICSPHIDTMMAEIGFVETAYLPAYA